MPRTFQMYLPAADRARFEAAMKLSGKTSLAAFLRSAAVAACERIEYAHAPACTARIFHGPGHQSSTTCQLKGPHSVHEATYGEFDQLAQWRGDKVFSGPFDQPPSNPQP